MVNAAFILGIVSITCAVFMRVYLPMICGSIGVICAILSRDRSGRFEHHALIGLILSIVGIVINIITITFSFYTVFTDPVKFAEYNEMLVQYTGMDFNTYMDELKSSFAL